LAKNRNLLLFILICAGLGTSYLLYDQSRTSYVDIEGYEGANLSSINDFRENSINGPQYIIEQSYRLNITGLVDEKLSLTYEDVVTKHPIFKKVVTLHCVEGWDVTILWEGILIKDLLSEAGIQPNATTVIFYAADGYRTSLPLDYLLERDIIMAYKMNDVTLPPERGFPFQLVAENKWGYKWIKWITDIQLSSDESYEGFWESRGYSNSGDLDDYFYGD
jgi:DMSO/TMAO reductase YedYZ molybdopterin-dependent catalytic subunit